jgi:hypothetical protein
MREFRHGYHLILKVTFATLITDWAVQWVIDLQQHFAACKELFLFMTFLMNTSAGL